MAVVTTNPMPFVGGYRTIDGTLLNKVLSNPNTSRTDGLTAHAGGGQAAALPLFSTINRITTAASPADSVKLPRSSQQSICVVINSSSNPIQVFGNGTATINGAAAATGISLPAGVLATFYSPVEGNWNASLDYSGPIGVGAAATASATNAYSTYKLDTAAGSTLTLPPSTGSGVIFNIVVTTSTTSNAHKILAASSSDFLIGRLSGATAAGATLQFGSPAATNHSLQMPFAGSQPSGGIIGDWFTFTDIAANLWHVKGQYQSGTTATTPFSSATT